MSAVHHLVQGDSLAVTPHLENYICLKVLQYLVREELLSFLASSTRLYQTVLLLQQIFHYQSNVTVLLSFSFG